MIYVLPFNLFLASSQFKDSLRRCYKAHKKIMNSYLNVHLTCFFCRKILLADFQRAQRSLTFSLVNVKAAHASFHTVKLQHAPAGARRKSPISDWREDFNVNISICSSMILFNMYILWYVFVNCLFAFFFSLKMHEGETPAWQLQRKMSYNLVQSYTLHSPWKWNL